jgi:hypothetical protein
LAERTDLKWNPIFQWFAMTDPPFGARINEDKFNENLTTAEEKAIRARPSSCHPGVVVIGYGSGRVRPIHEKIDYVVYQQLCTPYGNGSAMPDRSYLLNEDDL